MLEKTLESPMDFKELKPGILKEISPVHSLEELILKWGCGALILEFVSSAAWLVITITKPERRRWAPTGQGM